MNKQEQDFLASVRDKMIKLGSSTVGDFVSVVLDKVKDGY